MKSKFTILLLLALLLIAGFACQASGPVGSLFASPTPTVTITPSATPTLTPSPTSTATPSRTPQPTGVHFEDQSNGGVQITDYDGGYSLVLSKDWVSVPADEDALKKAVESASENNPDLADSLDDMQDVIDNDTLRLIAFNTDKEYRDGTTYPNLVVITLEDVVIKSVPLDFLVDINVEQIKSGSGQATVLDSGTGRNANKAEYGFIYIDNRIKQGPRIVNVRQYILIIKVDSSMTLLTLTVPNGVKAKAEPLVQSLIDSISLLKD
jgi:hypothetical protein